MEKISRRRFLEDSLALLGMATLPAGVLAETFPRYRARVGANEKVRIACIGVNGRGMAHVRAYVNMDDVLVTYICDPDTATFAKAVKAIEEAGKPTPKTVQDIRRVIEDKSVDAISIATPNHWHALAAIWAMQAGKDVYVEKPSTYNIFEGQRMVEAAQKYGRVCQVGTQSRSSAGINSAMSFLHSGALGKIYLARGLCYKPRGSIGKVSGPQQPPSTVDYNLWLGPAPVKPVRRAHFHYDWHWQWDYGNGDLGNQGVHEMDKARWGLNKHALPKSVLALGGRFGYEDDGETPNTLLTFYDYGDSQLIFEVRGLSTDEMKPVKNGIGAKIGNIFYAEKGILVMPNYSSAIAYDNDGNKIKEFKGGGDHFRNFVDTMRSRNMLHLNCDAREGHLSAALCHIGNVSYLLGSQKPFNKKSKTFGDNKEAYETYARFEDHLRANGIKLEETYYRLGRDLVIDPDTETFVNDREANALLTRRYRAPFVVPEKV
jgi:predicted dehydrogenase